MNSATSQLDRVLMLITELVKQGKVKNPTDFAKKLSFDTGYFSLIRNGKRNVPLELLQKIAKYYNVDLDYLVEGKGVSPFKENNVFNAKEHLAYNRGVCYKVPIKAFGGFLTGYENPIFLESLEKSPNRVGSGTCFEFEIEGFSMYRHKLIDGEFWDYGYKPGSFVYTTPLEGGLKDCRKGKDYVFQTTDGIIIKTFEKIADNKCYVSSINNDYNPVDAIPVKSIKVVYSIDGEFNKH